MVYGNYTVVQEIQFYSDLFIRDYLYQPLALYMIKQAKHGSKRGRIVAVIEYPPYCFKMVERCYLFVCLI